MIHLVVDTNIFFNALLNLGGITTKLFFRQEKYDLRLVTSPFLIDEVNRYTKKLAKKQGVTEHEIQDLVDVLYKKLIFIDKTYYQDSYHKVMMDMEHVDPKDTDFVALAHKLKCPIWTNDKLLKQKITIVKVVNTEDVMAFLN